MARDRYDRRGEHVVDPVPRVEPYAYPAAGAGATQPAPVVGPGTGSMFTPRTGGGADPAAVSAGNFLAGAWLVLAPFALDYEDLGPGFDGYPNDIIVGIAIAAVALVRMLAPYRSVAIGAVNLALGAWLIAAPFVLAYNRGADATAATWNDIVVGVIVVVLALVSVVLAIRGPRDRTDAADE